MLAFWRIHLRFFQDVWIGWLNKSFTFVGQKIDKALWSHVQLSFVRSMYEVYLSWRSDGCTVYNTYKYRFMYVIILTCNFSFIHELSKWRLTNMKELPPTYQSMVRFYVSRGLSVFSQGGRLVTSVVHDSAADGQWGRHLVRHWDGSEKKGTSECWKSVWYDASIHTFYYIHVVCPWI